MKYLYVTDENLATTLLSKNMKLLNKMTNSNIKTWVFEYNPSLFSLDFNDISNRKTCFVSDKLHINF